jgi:hypothetical protein
MTRMGDLNGTRGPTHFDIALSLINLHDGISQLLGRSHPTHQDIFEHLLGPKIRGRCIAIIKGEIMFSFRLRPARSSACASSRTRYDRSYSIQSSWVEWDTAAFVGFQLLGPVTYSLICDSTCII